MKEIYNTYLKQHGKDYKQTILILNADILYNIEIFYSSEDERDSYALLSKWERGEYGNMLNINPVYDYGISNINPLLDNFADIIKDFKDIIKEL